MKNFSELAERFINSKLIHGLSFDTKEYIVEGGLVFFKNIQLNYMFHAYLQGITDA